MWLGSVGRLEGDVGRLKLLQLSNDCNNQQRVRQWINRWRPPVAGSVRQWMNRWRPPVAGSVRQWINRWRPPVAGSVTERSALTREI